MLALLLLLSVCLASYPICGFGHENYFFTNDPVLFVDYVNTCRGMTAEPVSIPDNMVGDQVIPWLMARRGMRTCGAFAAFVHCEGTRKAVNDGIGECCVVSPKGVKRYEECPADLYLPALCQFTP